MSKKIAESQEEITVGSFKPAPRCSRCGYTPIQVLSLNNTWETVSHDCVHELAWEIDRLKDSISDLWEKVGNLSG